MNQPVDRRGGGHLIPEDPIPFSEYQIATTNLAFQDWHTVFPNASCAVALVDRRTHHAELIPVEGESYRRREAELTRKKRR